MTDKLNENTQQESNEMAAKAMPSYPYAEWMLEEIKKEYFVENERENKIGTKASTFITVIVAIITLYIPILPLENLQKFWNAAPTTSTDKILMVIFIIVMSMGLLLLLVAFGFFVIAYRVKGYKRVNVDDLLDIANSIGKYDAKIRSQIAQSMVAHYHKILRGTLDEKGNMKTNSDSSKNVAIGIMLTVIGFVLLSVATMALRIIVIIP